MSKLPSRKYRAQRIRANKQLHRFLKKNKAELEESFKNLICFGIEGYEVNTETGKTKALTPKEVLKIKEEYGRKSNNIES